MIMAIMSFLSPYLLVLCTEILPMQTKNNGEITGIQIGNTIYKITEYTDDTQLLYCSILNNYKRYYTLEIVSSLST